jgi:hypothetical protein
MLERASRGYAGIRRVDILYAGPNSFDGSKPHVWYVIAEVRAQARSHGSEMGQSGSGYLQWDVMNRTPAAQLKTVRRIGVERPDPMKRSTGERREESARIR